MKIELVSKLGARLPRGGGLLDFGATEANARHRLESLAEPALTSFVPGVSWNWRVLIGDRWTEARAGADGLLGEIRVARAIVGGAAAVAGVEGVAGTAVLYRGIDLFEHTMAEIEFLLGALEGGGGRVHDLRLTGKSGYAQSVTLTDLARHHCGT
jgi:hypothetical protein